MNILVTGSAGFIGFYTAKHLLERGDTVTGLDGINDYYDVSLKYDRLKETGIDGELLYGQPVRSGIHDRYSFVRLNLEDREAMADFFTRNSFDVVCHLAAQAGVRYSLENPAAYIDSNISGFLNILEGCRHGDVKHLVFASSSSVYGLNEKRPFSTSDNVDHPVSLYAASKKSNELMAHTYSHLFCLPVTGLRFFTVYGPWGRPDMAYFSFTGAILKGKTIDVFNHGDLERDFTYIDDIVEGVVRVMDRAPSGDPHWDGKDPDPGSARAPYKIYNIGNSSPVKLMDFIAAIEKALGREAVKNFLPMQPGDVYSTFADVSDLVRDTGYRPDTPLENGIEKFVRWYREYYGV